MEKQITFIFFFLEAILQVLKNLLEIFSCGIPKLLHLEESMFSRLNKAVLGSTR